ncbi:F-box domain-containing protein [Aphelenchoides bicaudatus]|nr:F-box domain-containing protein [Aphelenchoides bicaudatus]
MRHLSNLSVDKHPSPKADSSLNGIDPFITLPWNVMYQIFNQFDMRDRLTAASVCKRWKRLLTDKVCSLKDVSVFNIFEKTIWDKKLSQNIQHGGKVECIHLNNFGGLDRIFVHCVSPRVVKIWYQQLDFLEKILEKISTCNLKLHSLDAYPYSYSVGGSLIYEFLPNLKHIALRPHSSDYFFTGLDIDHFPNFKQLDSLNLDSFNLTDDLKLPESLKTLEWQCRNEKSLPTLISKLEPLKSLEFLTIGHANFDGLRFLRFIQSVGYWNMTNLQYMYFKLVKFNISSIASCSDFSHRVLHALRVLKMELCYGSLRTVIELFLQMTSYNLKILSLSLLTNEHELSFKDLFGMSELFSERSLNIHLSLMEQSDPPIRESKEEEKSEKQMPTCPQLFAEMLTKFEASFITQSKTLTNILESAHFCNLTEIKLIQCTAANDKLLQAISQNCPLLERLSVLSCHSCTDAGIQHFVEDFHKRQSDSLKIIWQKERCQSAVSFITDFFINLTSKSPWLCDGLNLRSNRKQFRAKFGEQIAIWANTKMLYIQDFDFYDQNRVLGIVLPAVGCNEADQIVEVADKEAV